MENSNSQAQPAPTPVPPAGKTVEELQAELDRVKKESEGRLRDLQSERTKRQEIESRLPATPAAPTEVEVPQDELGKVLKPYIDPILREANAAKAFVQETLKDKAISHLMAKTGKSRDQVLNDQDLQSKLMNVAQRYGLNGNIHDLTVKAYDIVELEGLRANANEQARIAAANSGSSIPAGTPPPPVSSQREWSSDEWSALPLAEYEKLESQYNFKKNAEGKIVAVPK